MSHASSARFLVLHTLRLERVAKPEAIGAKTGLSTDAVHAELDALVALDLIEERFGGRGGFALLDAGVDVATELAEHELTTTGSRREVEAAYEHFLTFNRALLSICTRWQLRPDEHGEQQHNDHTDEPYDAGVIADLDGVHALAMDVLDGLERVLARFSQYRLALQTALDQIHAGDHDYFTKPMFPSYHSVWFEFHEDLLVTLGRNRGMERSN